MIIQCSNTDKKKGLIEENDQLKNYIKLLEGALKDMKEQVLPRNKLRKLNHAPVNLW